MKDSSKIGLTGAVALVIANMMEYGHFHYHWISGGGNAIASDGPSGLGAWRWIGPSWGHLLWGFGATMA